MTRFAVVVALLALGACTGPDPDRSAVMGSDTRQIPSTTEPGLHIGGHVNVGVVRTF